jgi:uncharacterized repeat protein (TIGR01451 family)
VNVNINANSNANVNSNENVNVHAPSGEPHLTLSKTSAIIRSGFESNVNVPSTQPADATRNSAGLIGLVSVLLGGFAIVSGPGRRRRSLIVATAACTALFFFVNLAFGQEIVPGSRLIPAELGLRSSDSVRYTISLKNDGGGTAYKVFVRDPLTDLLLYKTGSLVLDGTPIPDDGIYNVATRTIALSFQPIDAGHSTDIVFDTFLPTSPTASITNRAFATYSDLPPESASLSIAAANEIMNTESNVSETRLTPFGLGSGFGGLLALIEIGVSNDPAVNGMAFNTVAAITAVLALAIVFSLDATFFIAYLRHLVALPFGGRKRKTFPHHRAMSAVGRFAYASTLTLAMIGLFSTIVHLSVWTGLNLVLQIIVLATVERRVLHRKTKLRTA